MRALSSLSILTATFTAVCVAETDVQRLIEPVRPYVEGIRKSGADLPEQRRTVLDEVAHHILRRLSSAGEAKLTFVCTHNSRRSHFAQVWAQIAVHYFGLQGIRTFSGGTEATACNLRTIQALRRAGLSAVVSTEGTNPEYLIQFADDAPPIRAYSKTYDAKENPQEDYAAVLCCADADKRCPGVLGADARFPLHYDDPKVADGTQQESQAYDERCTQIAVEMFYVMAKVAEELRRSDSKAEQGAARNR